MPRPRFLDDDAFRSLRAGDLEAFHRLIADRKTVDFSGSDLRATDLRKVELTKVVLRDAYLKDADLRGLDLRELDLEGCSLHNAKIGGAYFPGNLSAAEIQMSLTHGTRLRAGPGHRMDGRGIPLRAGEGDDEPAAPVNRLTAPCGD